MQLNNLTGWKNPVFTVRRKSDNTLVDTLELDFTNGEGLVVEYEDVTIEHDILDYSQTDLYPDVYTEQYYVGTRYYWTLNYTELLQPENGMKIKQLLDYRMNNDMKFFLQPRKDNQNVYEVVKIGERSLLKMTGGGSLSSGDCGFKMKWKSRGLIKDLRWQKGNETTDEH
ncbi:MAG: hypothetical protein ACHQJ4_06680 [Ignavibacteria bacterium]